MSAAKTALGVLLILVLLFASGGWTVLQWRECKHMGHSAFYCVGHVWR